MEVKEYEVEDKLLEIEDMDIVRDMKDLLGKVRDLEIDIDIVKDYIDILDMMGKEKMDRCVFHDKRLGYCREISWNVVPRNSHLYDAAKYAGSHYNFIPEKSPALCAVCPFYRPKKKL